MGDESGVEAAIRALERIAALAAPKGFVRREDASLVRDADAACEVLAKKLAFPDVSARQRWRLYRTFMKEALEGWKDGDRDVELCSIMFHELAELARAARAKE